MTPKEVSFLKFLALKDLGFEPYEPNHQLVFQEDDILWKSNTGSYTRIREEERGDNISYKILSYLHKFYPIDFNKSLAGEGSLNDH